MELVKSEGLPLSGVQSWTNIKISDRLALLSIALDFSECLKCLNQSKAIDLK